MAPAIRPFSDEQLRALINLRPRYENLVAAQRDLARLPYNLVRKTVGGRDYLYEVIDRANNAKSLGPMTPEHEQRLADYRDAKAGLQDRIKASTEGVAEIVRLARPLRLPTFPAPPGEILRELDRRGLLDGTLLVVGTNCIPAYSLEAGGAIADAPAETEDFDLAWAAEQQAEDAALWNALKAVDPTFTINAEREFQARNRQAYEIELLVAPSRVATMNPREKPRPIPLPEQEWLLLGKPVDHILPCRDGKAVRVVAPDPRWFALHKLWLGDQAKRNPLKRRKDTQQGNAVLSAVAEAMPQYPLDPAFVATIPDELQPYWQGWAKTRSA
jgi:hypothetical protein